MSLGPLHYMGDAISQRRLRKFARKHPRFVAGALATLLLGIISTTMLVSDVGAAFGSDIPVMSGIQTLDNPDAVDDSAPGVSI